MKHLILALLFAFPQVKENPRAAAANIYPHPPEPQHLESYQLDATFEIKVKHLFWTRREPVHCTCKIDIQQQRPKGGWWRSNVRYPDSDGQVISTIQFDSTWTPKPIVLFILLDDFNRQLAHAQVEVTGKEIKGRILLLP